MLSLENVSQENHQNGKNGNSNKQAVKKILPSVPSVESSLSTSLKMIDRPTSAPRSNTAYGPFFLEYSLMAEYVLVQKQRLPGVYIVPSASSALKWFGVIFVRHGIYQGGVFRFTLYIPNNYPECDCPILVFEPAPFHPLVDFQTGELDLKRTFQKWRRNVNHLWQVLLYARRIFYNVEIEAPSNVEAADLYDKDRELFKQRVMQSINACQEKLYERPNTDDPHAICFSPWNPDVHEEVRQRILSEKKDDDDDDQNEKSSSNGLSWVQKGTLQIFSKTT